MEPESHVHAQIHLGIAGVFVEVDRRRDGTWSMASSTRYMNWVPNGELLHELFEQSCVLGPYRSTGSMPSHHLPFAVQQSSAAHRRDALFAAVAACSGPASTAPRFEPAYCETRCRNAARSARAIVSQVPTMSYLRADLDGVPGLVASSPSSRSCRGASPWP